VTRKSTQRAFLN
jgi:hypothetical protein